MLNVVTRNDKTGGKVPDNESENHGEAYYRGHIRSEQKLSPSPSHDMT